MPKRYSQNCEFCKKHYVGEGKRFCSPKCAGNLKKSFICISCDKSFWVHRQTAKYCSRKCWFDSLKVTDFTKKENRVHKICELCKKDFYMRPHLKQIGRFCSRECADRWRSESAQLRYLDRYKAAPFFEEARRTNVKVRYVNLLNRCKKIGTIPPPKHLFTEWYHSTPKLCCYCDVTQEILELINGANVNRILHIDRMNNDKGYEIENMAFSCGACNVVKNAYLTYNEMRYVGQNFMKPKWQKRISTQKSTEGVMV